MTEIPGAPVTGAIASRKTLSKRRLALMATVAGLGAAVLLSSPYLPANPPLPAFGAVAHAQTAMRPASFADIVEKVKPAVFAVRVKVEDQNQQMSRFGGEELPFPPGSPMERFFKRFGFGDGPGNDGMRPRGPHGQGQMPGRRHFSMAQGSGFFISADGFAVTNNHVVERGQSIEIKMDDGKTYDAKVIGTDPRTDLALIKVEGRSDFPFVRFAPKSPRIGDWVLAVGNPFGLGGTVTAGIVSASGRDIGAGPYDDFIQIDAAVNRGNSGGPTFNVNGEVIGVNTAIFSPSGGNVGIAFAIPSETTQNVVAALREGGSVQRGWIGVQIQGLTPEIAESLRLTKPEGALVAGIQPGSPAAASDLKPSDVIVSVDGQPVKDARELTRRIGAARPGTTVRLGVIRDGAERNVGLTLGRLPGEGQMAALQDGRRDRRSDAAPEANPTGPRLGLSVEPAGRGQGLVVTEVDPSGPAAQRGIRPGDVILDVAGRSVSSLRDVREALGAARADGRRSALIRLRSGEGQRFVAIPLDPG